MGPHLFFPRPQDTMEYRKKQRPLKIRMLDGTVKTVMVDDSKTVTDMLMTICARIGKAAGGARGSGPRGEGPALPGDREVPGVLPTHHLPQASPTMTNIRWCARSWKRKRRR